MMTSFLSQTLGLGTGARRWYQDVTQGTIDEHSGQVQWFNTQVKHLGRSLMINASAKSSSDTKQRPSDDAKH